MSNLPYPLFGGHDRQTLFVFVEVTSPDGNFEILGKSFLPTIFFNGAHLTKLWSKKYFS
jgi:hypothetical protein